MPICLLEELPRIIDAELISTQPEPEGHGFVWKGKENIRMDHMVPWSWAGIAGVLLELCQLCLSHVQELSLSHLSSPLSIHCFE